MLTTVSAGVPAATPTGRLVKPSRTDSPSSSTESCVARKLTVLVVSPLLNVTVEGRL